MSEVIPIPASAFESVINEISNHLSILLGKTPENFSYRIEQRIDFPTEKPYTILFIEWGPEESRKNLSFSFVNDTGVEGEILQKKLLRDIIGQMSHRFSNPSERKYYLS